MTQVGRATRIGGLLRPTQRLQAAHEVLRFDSFEGEEMRYGELGRGGIAQCWRGSGGALLEFRYCFRPPMKSLPIPVEYTGGCALKPFFHRYFQKLKSWFLGSTNAEFHAELKDELIFGIYAFRKPWEAFEV